MRPVTLPARQPLARRRPTRPLILQRRARLARRSSPIGWVVAGLLVCATVGAAVLFNTHRLASRKTPPTHPQLTSVPAKRAPVDSPEPSAPPTAIQPVEDPPSNRTRAPEPPGAPPIATQPAEDPAAWAERLARLILVEWVDERVDAHIHQAVMNGITGAERLSEWGEGVRPIYQAQAEKIFRRLVLAVNLTIELWPTNSGKRGYVCDQLSRYIMGYTDLWGAGVLSEKSVRPLVEVYGAAWDARHRR